MISPVSSASYTFDSARASSGTAAASSPPQAAPVAATETLQSGGNSVADVDTQLQYFALNESLDMNKTLAAQVVSMVQAISSYTANAGGSSTGGVVNTTA